MLSTVPKLSGGSVKPTEDFMRNDPGMMIFKKILEIRQFAPPFVAADWRADSGILGIPSQLVTHNWTNIYAKWSCEMRASLGHDKARSRKNTLRCGYIFEVTVIAPR